MPSRVRLDPNLFQLPVAKMRAGYYSDKYFVRSRDILLAERHRPRVTMQVFGKAAAFLGGIDEAIAILKLCASEWASWTCGRSMTATKCSPGKPYS
jgi:nicotinate phosphoribosyltransferase